MDFLSFLLVNVVLFLRPSELMTELAVVPIYYASILLCLACSIVHLIRFLTIDPVLKHPTVILVFTQLGIAAISLLLNNDVSRAFDEEIEFAKSILYFTLFLALVRTPQRLQTLIGLVVVCMMITAILGMLHYYDYLSIQSLVILEQPVLNPQTNEYEVIRRLRFTGILNDPNEAAVFLAFLSFFCVYQLTSQQYGLYRYAWLAPLGVYLAAFGLTWSRGGLLSLLVGLIVFAFYRFGRKRGILFLSLILPVLLVGFAGRQTTISASEETAMTRFELWSDWLQDFRRNPMFGVGPKVIPDDKEKSSLIENRHCAHNSYVQSFADLGFAGGLCFLGSFAFALETLRRYRQGPTIIYQAELARLHPYMIAATAGYAVGAFTLTLNYYITTYFVLALPLAYYGMTPCYPALQRPSLSIDTLVKLAVGGVAFLAFIYVFVNFMLRA